MCIRDSAPCGGSERGVSCCEVFAADDGKGHGLVSRERTDPRLRLVAAEEATARGLKEQVELNQEAICASVMFDEHGLEVYGPSQVPSIS